MRSRIIIAGLATPALGISVALAGITTAEAATGCGYPYVCVYMHGTNREPSGRFRDVTAGWQHFSRSYGARSVRNTRHDDVAYLLTVDGRTVCVPPRTTGGMLPDGMGFRAIRISSSSRC